MAVVDRLRKPEQFRRIVDLVGIPLGADAAGLARVWAPPSTTATVRAAASFPKAYPSGSSAVKVYSPPEAVSGKPSQDQVRASSTESALPSTVAVMPVGSIETTASRSTGFSALTPGRGSTPSLRLSAPIHSQERMVCYRRVLGGIRFLRSVSFLHGSGAGGQVAPSAPHTGQSGLTLSAVQRVSQVHSAGASPWQAAISWAQTGQSGLTLSRRAKGLTDTFRRRFRFAAVRRVAEFAVRRIKGAGAALGIAAGLIVDVRTVQFFCDAAAFSLHTWVQRRLLFPRLRREASRRCNTPPYAHGHTGSRGCNNRRCVRGCKAYPRNKPQVSSCT